MVSQAFLSTTKKIIFPLVALLILFLFVGWWYNATANRRYLQRIYVPLYDQYDVVAFGDSLIEGVGASQSYGFISILADRLGLEIYNAGIRRSTTSSALERLDRDVLSFLPKLVIISIGGNDHIRGIQAEDVFQNLYRIIDRIQSTGASVLLLGVPGGTFSDEYEEYYPLLVAETGIYYVPNILQDILFHPRVMFDPIHPNDRGHHIIANRVEPILINILDELGIAYDDQGMVK